MTDDPRSSPTCFNPHSRVLVTGIGLVTSLGSTREASWNALKNGTQGFRRLDRHPGDPLWFGAPVESDGCHEPTSIRAVLEAWDDAALASGAVDLERIGTVFGSSKGDIKRHGMIHEAVFRFGPSSGTDTSMGPTPGRITRPRASCNDSTRAAPVWLPSPPAPPA